MKKLLCALAAGVQFGNKIALWVAMACLFTLIMAVVWEVVARSVFNAPTKWSLEISEYLLVAIVFLPLAWDLTANKHVNVDVFTTRFSRKTQAILEVIAFCFSLFIVVVLIRESWNLAWYSWQHKLTSQTVMAFPLFPSQVTIPIGAFLLGATFLIVLSRRIAALRVKTNKEPDG